MEDAEPVGLFAVPLHLNPSMRDKHKPLFDHLVAHPYWFSTSLDADEIRQEAALGLVQPDVRSWEVWNGGKMVGLLLLTRLLPGVDAVVHFTFWGTTLFAARRLILSWLGHVLEEYDLQRVSLEVPEYTKGILSFARQKLGFRFEGENGCARHKIRLFLESDDAKRHGVLTHEAAQWLARQGARRESAHWDPKSKRFRDVYLLRLLRREYLERSVPASERAAREHEVTACEHGGEEGGA